MAINRNMERRLTAHRRQMAAAKLYQSRIKAGDEAVANPGIDILREIMQEIADYARDNRNTFVTPKTMRLKLTDWVSALEQAKPMNVQFAREIDTAIRQMQALHRNGNDLYLGSQMLALGSRWWDNLLGIFKNINSVLNRKFDRTPSVPYSPYGEARYTANHSQYLERDSSTDIQEITDRIIEGADKAMLSAGVIQNSYGKMFDLLNMQAVAVGALVREFNKVCERYASVFPTRSVQAVKAIKAEPAEIDLEKQIIRLTRELKRTPTAIRQTYPINPEMTVYGSKLKDGKFRGIVRNQEDKEAYALKKQIYDLWSAAQHSENDKTVSVTMTLEEELRFADRRIKEEQYIDPKHVIHGTYVSAPAFRTQTAQDRTDEIYNLKKLIWEKWATAWRAQSREIDALRQKLIELEKSPNIDIPNNMEYDGVLISAPRFRARDEGAESKVVYELKERIWKTYKFRRAATENQVIVNDFQKFYGRLSEIVDDIYDNLSYAQNNARALAVLGSDGQKSLNDLWELMAVIDGYTRAPWNQDFIYGHFIANTTFLDNLILLEKYILGFATQVREVVKRLDDDIKCLRTLRSSIDKPGTAEVIQNMPEFPKDSSEGAVNQFIAAYLDANVNPDGGIGDYLATVRSLMIANLMAMREG